MDKTWHWSDCLSVKLPMVDSWPSQIYVYVVNIFLRRHAEIEQLAQDGAKKRL